MGRHPRGVDRINRHAFGNPTLVSGFQTRNGFRGSGFEFRVPGSESKISCSGFRVLDFQIQGFGFQYMIGEEHGAST